MKKALTALLLLLCASAHAVTTYITFNPLNCINCSSALYDLHREKGIQHINLVLKEEFKEDTAEINEQYSLNELKKLHWIFSDSLYKQLSHEAIDAELVVMSDGHKELYRTNLKRISMNEVRAYYYGASGTDSICYNSLKKMGSFRAYGNYIIALGNLGNNTFINHIKHTETPVKITDSLKQKLYRFRYQDSFNIKYPVIAEQIKETPSLKPNIMDVRLWDARSLMVLYDIKDYRITGIQNSDTSMELWGVPIITRYSLETGETVIYKVKLPAKFFMWDFFIEKGRYYAQGIYEDETYALMELTCDEAVKTFSVKKILPLKQPADYKQRAVSSMEEFNTTIHGNLIAFTRDYYITRLDDMKHIRIPIANAATRAWNSWEIRDLWEDNNNYYVLYAMDNNLHVMQIPKNGKPHKDVIAASTTEVDYRHMQFYGAGNLVLYKPLGKTCLLVKELQF